MLLEKYLFVERDSSEWSFMWKQLSGHVLNHGLEEPAVCLNGFQSWQYMGSNSDEKKHVFRHRSHPKTSSREYIEIPFSDEFQVIGEE
ncbi:hypothetical protein ACH42_02865 [Endozoicomonas sp. (ex Bugula neritina AB1)]|nr:hypothetical protein ACH42_02865 [Endozoicomonas sp. (ex Bugula neritina AB1)]